MKSGIEKNQIWLGHVTMEFYIYWGPERWTGEPSRWTGERWREINGIVDVQVRDGDTGSVCKWLWLKAMFSISEESNGVACVTAFKLCWLVLIHVWVSCDISKNGKHRPPTVVNNFRVRRWFVNITPTWLTEREKRKKGLTGNWTQDLSQILYSYLNILRKDHTARPSGLINLMFGFIYC